MRITKARIEQAARSITRMGGIPWRFLTDTAKNNRRKLARWHLRAVEKARQEGHKP